MTRRDTSSDVFAAFTEGEVGFRTGKPLPIIADEADVNYVTGWLAAAEDMRDKHAANAQRPLTNLETVIDVLQDAQRAIKDLTPAKGLTGGRGIKLAATKSKIAALLEALEAKA